MPDTPLHSQVQAHLTVERLDEAAPTGGSRRIVPLQPVSPLSLARVGQARAGKARAVRIQSGSFARANRVLFLIALGLYLVTRFVGLTTYPVYFHGDEAIHTVYASELIRDKGKFEANTFLPTYFKNGPKYNLSLSVYLQILPVLLFGKSIVVTRAISILLTLIPAAAVTLIVRDFLKLPYSWTATLLLALIPAWFLHSRTAFETVLAVSMYAGFLYEYMRYRLENPRYLYAALAFGALTFYAYSPAQLVIVTCGFLLLLFDFRYHLQHWRTGLGGLGWLFLLTLPYLRFRLQVDAPIEEHLRDLGSYWLAPLSLSSKLLRFGQEYVTGLSAGYWYTLNVLDLPRHQMGPYPHVLRATLPFALLGGFIAIRSVVMSGIFHWFKLFLPNKNPSPVENRPHLSTPPSPVPIAYRIVLLALLISPLPGTLAQVGITRVLTFVIPITILTAVGLISCLRWFERWLPPQVVMAGAMVVLGGGLLLFTRDTLRNGPFWVQEYGFGGMQYGAQPLFDKINTYLDSYNHIQIVLTPNWANGTDDLADFFLDNPFAIEMASIDSFLLEKRVLQTNHLLVLTPEEFARAQASNKFKAIEVKDTLAYPNGKVGFYFIHVTYADNIDDLLAQERADQLILHETTLTIQGGPVTAYHSSLDIGPLRNVFDGDDQTLIRTERINPFVLEMDFPEPQEFHGVSINVGASILRLTVQLYSDPDAEPVEFAGEARTTIEAPIMILNFGETVSAQKIRLEVLLLEDSSFGHVHIWEIRFLGD